MVNNSDQSGNKTRTTEKYKLISETLKDGLDRLEADKKYFQSLTKSKDLRTKQQGFNGVKATSIQIAKQKSAIRIDHSENVQALNRGEIFKFW